MQDERRLPDREAPWPNAATVVLAAETEEERRWATSTAIELARKLARACPKVVMADLQLTGGGFSHQLGVDDSPGIADVLFRGSTFSKVARRPKSESFYYLPIGTSPPPLEELYGSTRWERIAERFREVDAYLLLCVSAEAWRAAGPMPGFEAAIVLNASGDEVAAPEGADVVSEFLAPPEIRGSATAGAVDLPEEAPTERIDAAPGDSVESEPIEADDAVLAAGELEAREPFDFDAARSDPAPIAASEGWEEEWSDSEEEYEYAAAPAGKPVWKVGLSRRLPTGPGPMIVAAAAVVVVGLGLWWAFGGGNDADRVEAAAGSPATATRVAQRDPTPESLSAEPRPTVEERPLPYSVLIASYSSFQDALDRRRQWTRAELPFYVAPTVVRGVVYYRVLAGMLPTRDQAVELMRALVQDGVKDTVRNWDVRPARLAFDFGTFPDRKAAEGTVETLTGQGVPAYVVPVAGKAGEVAYRVYAGGYEETRDARPLEQQIDRSGLEAKLVERVGAVKP